MAKSKPTDVIDAYRKRQQRKSLFTFGDISKALIFLIMLAASLYVLFAGKPDLPVLIELKTNTPTFTPSITPTPTQTATITLTPTETPDPELQLQCDCPSPEIIIVTATFSASDTPKPLPSATQIATLSFTETPTDTPLPTETRTPTPSATPTPTQIVYTVQAGDTLSDIALRFGVTVEAIQALNNLDTPLIIQGQTLQIPRP